MTTLPSPSILKTSKFIEEVLQNHNCRAVRKLKKGYHDTIVESIKAILSMMEVKYMRIWKAIFSISTLIFGAIGLMKLLPYDISMPFMFSLWG